MAAANIRTEPSVNASSNEMIKVHTPLDDDDVDSGRTDSNLEDDGLFIGRQMVAEIFAVDCCEVIVEIFELKCKLPVSLVAE